MIRKLVALFRTYERRDAGDRRRNPHSDGDHRRGGVRRARRVGSAATCCASSTTRARGAPTGGHRSDANPPARQPAEVRPARHRRRAARRGARRACAGGRAGRRGGTLPDRPGARRTRRRCSSASRSGASWSRRSTRPARAAGLDQRAQRVREHVGRHAAPVRATASVRRFFLNFPDPWFKSRQHKRRVIGPGLMVEIGRALAPGGELYVQTDIFALALDAMAALEASSVARTPLRQRRGPWTFLRESPYDAKSRRERQCESRGCSGLAVALSGAGRSDARRVHASRALARAHREADLFQLLDAVAERGGLLELERLARGRTSRGASPR